MKILNLIIIILSVQISFSQNLTSTYSKISETCGADIASKFKEKNDEIKNNLNGKVDLKLAVVPIRNSRQEYTEISKNLSPKIQNIFQQKVKANISMFNSVSIDYVENPENLSNYDYILSANYFISKGNFTIDNIWLKKPDKSSPIALASTSIPINTDELQIKDYALISDNIKQLSRSLVVQYSNLEGLKNVKLNNFVYLKDKTATEFSEYLATNLESDFISIAGIEVKRNVTRSLSSSVQYEISGTYSIEGDKIKVTSVLKDPVSKITKGSATAYLKISYLQNNDIAYQQRNEEIFQKRQEVLKKTSVKNDFTIDVWTNKGNQNPIFREGDTLQISLNVSQECYVRLIDVFSDGTQILLLDSKIDASQVGKDYTIQPSFVCIGPNFGAETIIVMAKVGKPFPKLNTVDYYGYNKITDKLSTSRGFGPAVSKAEKHINVLTMPK